MTNKDDLPPRPMGEGAGGEGKPLTLKVVALLKKTEFTGHTVQPYICAEESGHYIVASERITKLNIDTLEGLPEVARSIFNLSEELDPAAVMARFTKKKISLKDFFSQKTAIIEEFAKPFIDQKLSEIIDLLVKHNIPLYDASALPHLYPSDKINIEPGKANTILHFNRTEDGTIYSLKANINKQPINLQKQGIELLTNQPCYLLTGDSIVGFDKSVSGKLLVPFFQKDNIIIPKRLENKYFSTFIRKIVSHSDIIATGFSIHDNNIEPQARLTYEVDWQGKQCLVLRFLYGEKAILPNNPQRNFTDLRSDEDGFTFYRSKRNKVKEDALTKKISTLGLTRYDNCFRLTDDNSDDYALITWLQNNRETLLTEGIEVSQDVPRQFSLDVPEIAREMITGNDWFDLNIVVRVGTFEIPFTKFRRHILNRQREYQLPDGSIFLIPSAWMEQYRQLMIHSETVNEYLRLARHHYRLLETVNAEEVIEFRKPTEPLTDLLPELRDVILRPYQITGYQWLKQLTNLGFGGILADDMGLGKTLQTIALLASYYQDTKRNEIILPKEEQNAKEKKKDEKPNFAAQLDLFNPAPVYTEKPTKINERRDTMHGISATHNDQKPCSLIVMPASLIHNWSNELERFAPNLRYYDYTGSSRKQKSNIFKKYDVLLTTYGTLRNDIDFLKSYTFAYCILDESQQIKNPSSKTAQAAFELKAMHRIVLTGTPVENNLTDLWSQMNFVNPGLLGSNHSFTSYYSTPLSKDPEGSQSEKLLKMIEPFILRRTKESVAPELPELLETIWYCTMTDEQAELYEKEKSQIRNLMFEQLEKGDVPSSAVMVLKALMQLRQIANHPGMVDTNSEIPSGKFEEITGKLETIIQENHRVLVFSSFVKHLNLVADYCNERGFAYSLLTGSTKDRGKVINEFRNDEATKIFLISMKAGGVGLNLTEADYVFMLDPWWNPAAEMQAVNRAHRIGQKRNVFVYRFVTKNTIEEKILNLQSRKKALADTFIKPQEAVMSMSREELMRLFD